MVSFIGKVKYNTPWSHFERTSSEYIMFFIHSGDMYIQESQTKYHLKANDIFMLSPHKKHFGYKEAKCVYSFVHFELENMDEVNEEFGEEKEAKIADMFFLNKNVVFHGGPYKIFHIYVPKYIQILDSNTLYSLKKIFDEGISEYFNAYMNYPVICSMKLTEFLMVLYRYCFEEKKITYSKKISKSYFTARELKKYLDDNAYRSVSSEMITEEFELNYDYLNRLLKKYFSISIRQYILIQKINAAKIILTNNDIKINVVGDLVGIDNPYYFSKLFKKHVGISPIEFYKEVRLSK